jgi:hypothetical protein
VCVSAGGSVWYGRRQEERREEAGGAKRRRSRVRRTGFVWIGRNQSRSGVAAGGGERAREEDLLPIINDDEIPSTGQKGNEGNRGGKPYGIIPEHRSRPGPSPPWHSHRRPQVLDIQRNLHGSEKRGDSRQQWKNCEAKDNSCCSRSQPGPRRSRHTGREEQTST